MRVIGALYLIPTAAVCATLFGLAWREQGSILAPDWLPYALGAGLLVATLVASGAALRPTRGHVAGLAALAGLALWTALSASWSPVPALARDEALLALFYASALAVPLLTLRTEAQRLGAIAIVVATSVLLAVATSARLLAESSPADLYWGNRLASPMGYPGADAALFLLSFWPAVALSANRRLPPVVRALALGGAVALLAGWLMTQSRAGTVSLAVSAVVVFAVAPGRLRLLVPLILAAALAGSSYETLTDPFQEEGAALDEAIRDAARWTLVLSLAGVAVGIAYALFDLRLRVPARLARAAGYAAVVAVALGAAAGVGGFLLAVEEPRGYLGDRWEEFKRQPERETGSSHLVAIGSNRYDFWRVALDEFSEHPIAGAGGRAFGPAYLREGDTDETPKRSHSLPLDVLSETGLVGLVLLVGALAPFAWTVLRRARSDLVTAGLLGAAAYWLVHASGDWTWTFPAVGVPFFLLLGSGAAAGPSPRTERGTRSRGVLPVGLALAAAAVFVFAPPWLSSRYTVRAFEQRPADASDDLRWARRLDPLSVEPLVAEAELAASPNRAISPLQKAIEREPRSLGPRYLLGLAYLEAGRSREARRELRKAVMLAPRSEAARQALRRAETARGGG
jgi:tetratricopeptide (TPR) repeat protein